MTNGRTLFLFCILFSVLSLESSGQDISGTWELQGTPGSFSPAGWYNSEAPALTRVQAARMKLVITAAVDERFDPVKGKKATLKFYKINDALKYENELRINAGTVLLEDLAKASGLPLRVIEENNPHLIKDVLPKGVSIYGLDFVPNRKEALALVERQEDYTTALAMQYERRRNQVLSFMPDPNKNKAVTYTVRSGDFLGRIASRTGTSVSDIKKWNKLKGNTIYPGQKLTVWVPKGKKVATPQVAKAPAKKPAAKATADSQKVDGSFLTYEVKPGDTLWSIAQKFPGVSADNLKNYNKMNALIKAGEQVKIPTQMITDYSPEKYPGAQ